MSEINDVEDNKDASQDFLRPTPEKERLTGIMYSKRRWIVKPWMKAVFFYCAIALLAGLVAFGVEKRSTMARLVIDSVVEAVPMTAIKAPGFELPNGDGAKITLDQYKGKWVFINFWATWCPPCRDEMASLEMLNRKVGKDGLVMLAVSVDEDWDEVKRFFGDTKPSFEVLWDKTKTVATGLYQTRKFPESYLIDPEGNVAAKFVGQRNWFNLGTVQYFEEVLNGKRDPRRMGR